MVVEAGMSIENIIIVFQAAWKVITFFWPVLFVAIAFGIHETLNGVKHDNPV